MLDCGVRGPLNLGNPSEMSVIQLANLIIGLTGSSSKVIYEPLPEDDPTRRRPDIGRAEELLDWKPWVAPNEGLQRTIDWFVSAKNRTLV
jgi:nucleoside-diphosphate-sugar epimerase